MTFFFLCVWNCVHHVASCYVCTCLIIHTLNVFSLIYSLMLILQEVWKEIMMLKRYLHFSFLQQLNCAVLLLLLHSWFDIATFLTCNQGHFLGLPIFFSPQAKIEKSALFPFISINYRLFFPTHSWNFAIHGSYLFLSNDKNGPTFN